MQITGHGARMHGNRRSFGLYLAHSTQYGVDSPSPAADVTLVDAAPAARRPERDLEAKVGSFSLDPRLVELVKARASQINDCARCWQQPTSSMMTIDRWNYHLPVGFRSVHWKAANGAAS